MYLLNLFIGFIGVIGFNCWIIEFIIFIGLIGVFELTGLIDCEVRVPSDYKPLGDMSRLSQVSSDTGDDKT